VTEQATGASGTTRARGTVPPVEDTSAADARGPSDETTGAAGVGSEPDRGRRGAARFLHPVVDPKLAASLALGVGGGLLLAQMATAVFVQLRTLLAIVMVSLFLSFAMEPAVQWFARRGVRRGFGTAIVFFGLLLLLAGFVAAMLPLIVDQVANLIDGLPLLVRELSDLAERLPGEAGDTLAAWLDEQRRALPDRTPDVAATVGRGAIGVGQTVLGGAFQLATIGLVTFYLVADAPKLRYTLASRLEPQEQVRVLGLWELAIAKTGGYVYSRALTAIVSSIFHVIVFTLLGLPYAAALGVWVGLISSLIPAVGTYLAGALPLVVALAGSPVQALWVLLAVVAYQQVENYYIVPKITATTMELHPAIAFLAVVGGAALGGAIGALLAIPAIAIVTALFSAAAEEYQVLEHTLLETGAEEAIDLVEEAGAGGDRSARSRLRRSSKRDRPRQDGPAPRQGPRQAPAPEPSQDPRSDADGSDHPIDDR
jgi:predicted PurR-regulated permease PerM